MPLIDITMRPGAQFVRTDGRRMDKIEARGVLRKKFGPALPGLFVEHKSEYDLDDNTPPEAVQVMFHEFDRDDINVPDLWIKVSMTEFNLSKSLLIRDVICDDLQTAIRESGIQMPGSFAIDIIWGPTNGAGRINGVSFVW